MIVKDISFEVYKGISRESLQNILSRIEKIKVGVIGDLCMDIYWRADMKKSELSRETPNFSLPVVQEWMSPGAGGNVVCNIASLKPGKILVLGITGKDWRGDILKNVLSENKSINIDGVITSKDRVTEAYCKPLRYGISNIEYEDPRIDFLNYQPPSKEEENKLMDNLDQMAEKVDIICVSDQFKYGCISSAVKDKINELGAKGYKIIVDSRHKIGMFRNVMLKPNEFEGWIAVHGKSKESSSDLNDLISTAITLSRKNEANVCMTLGRQGCVYTDREQATYICSHEVKPPIDICGAGDAFLSAFACSMAAEATATEAASIANMAADVIIKKIATTGTVNTEEIWKRYNEIYQD